MNNLVGSLKKQSSTCGLALLLGISLNLSNALATSWNIFNPGLGEMEHAITTDQGLVINKIQSGYDGAWVLIAPHYFGVGQPFSVGSDSSLEGASLRLASQSASGDVTLSIREFNPVTMTDGANLGSIVIPESAYAASLTTPILSYFDLLSFGITLRRGDTYLLALTVGADFGGSFYAASKTGGPMYYLSSPESSSGSGGGGNTGVSVPDPVPTSALLIIAIIAIQQCAQVARIFTRQSGQ